MEDIGKEEEKIMEEGGGNENLSNTHVHARVEEGQEPNPNPVDYVELETQKSIHGNGVELHGGSGVPVDSVPNVLETPGDVNIADDPTGEARAGAASDKIDSNVGSGVHCESEVSVKVGIEEYGGEEGEALEDDTGSKVDPSIELCAGSETDNLVDDGGLRDAEVPMEIEKEKDDVEEEKERKGRVSSKANTSDEPAISAGGDNVACEMELDIAATEKLIAGVSSEVNTSNEPNISAEIDNVACEMELDMPRDSEVATEKLIDGVSSDANPSSKTHISSEIDNVVSKVEPAMPHDSQVATEKLIHGVSNKAKSSNEPYSSAENDNLVCKVKPDMSCDSEVETEKLIDGVSSEAKSSNEPDSNAETDNLVCKVKPDMPRDSEVETERLIDEVSSEANPFSERHISGETDNFVCKVEPDMSRDSEVAMEKLIDGGRSETNPSIEPHISAETDNVVCEVEPDKMPRDRGVAMEKMIDGLNIKDNPSNEPHISAEIDNVVRKVEPNMPCGKEVEMGTESDDVEKREALNCGVSNKTKLSLGADINEQVQKPKFYVGRKVGMKSVYPKKSFLGAAEDDDSGTEEERAEFMKEVEKLYKEKYLEFKAPKFYREELNLLKLWRAVVKLGGYEKVTSCKLWRQVGETFNPPKTCTTVSWTFRIFYEKALLEFEKDRLQGSELTLPAEPTRVENRADTSQTLGSGRALRDANLGSGRALRDATLGSGRALRDSAARAMQGWHSNRLVGNGEVGSTIIKDKHLSTMPKSDKQLKVSGLLKRKKPSHVDFAVQVADMKPIKPRLDTMVFDIGPPADWVKVNVKRFDDCFEVYALVPGLLREEVHVQSDPVGRLIISGQPTQLDNPWGVTPFKKVVSLPSRIDPHQTSAVVTLNGQLYVRVPFEQSDF